MAEQLKANEVVKPTESTALDKYNEQKFVEVGEKFSSDIILPKNYDVVGSMKSLHLMCLNSAQGNLINGCTAISIEMAIRTVLQNGWNPMKAQCYPVKMGDKLTILPSYFGQQRTAYSSNSSVVKGSIHAQVICKGDKFVDKILPDGRRIVIQHTQAPFETRTNEYIGAYATAQIIINNKIESISEVMTLAEIQQSWLMSRTSGDTHKKFPVQMMRKTVITRLSKSLSAWTNENFDSIDEGSTSPTEDNAMNEPTIEYDIPDTETICDTNIFAVNNDVVDNVQGDTAPTPQTTMIVNYDDYTKNKDKYEKVGEYDKENDTIEVKLKA